MKVRVEMDEGWMWWFVTAKTQEELFDAMGMDDTYRSVLRKRATMEVPQELFDRAAAAQKENRAVQELLEQLYRVQEGIPPWETPEVPEHEVLPCTQQSPTTS